MTNIDGDAAKEIVVGDNQWGNVTAYDYDVEHNTVAIALQSNSQDHGVTSIGAGDIDHDGRLELVWGSGASSSGADRLVVAGRNPPTNAFGVEWINDDPIQLDGPFVGGELAGTSQLPPAPLFASPRTNSGYAGVVVGSTFNGQPRVVVRWTETPPAVVAFWAALHPSGVVTVSDFPSS